MVEKSKAEKYFAVPENYLKFKFKCDSFIGHAVGLHVICSHLHTTKAEFLATTETICSTHCLVHYKLH